MYKCYHQVLRELLQFFLLFFLDVPWPVFDHIYGVFPGDGIFSAGLVYFSGVGRGGGIFGDGEALPARRGGFHGCGRLPLRRPLPLRHPHQVGKKGVM